MSDLKHVSIKNKRATYDYEMLDTYIAGIVLSGTEIKSLRLGKASLVDCYCYFHNHELYVRGMNISEYHWGSYNNHMPKRDRKLLLQRRELAKLERALQDKGLTIVGIKLFGLAPGAAAAIATIGGADGPTAIFVTVLLAPALLGPIAVAAYSYMALVPVIQPPIMKLLTTEKERQIVMKPLREVSKKEKIVFPIVVTIFVALLVPSAAPLIACLMLGNLFKECGVTERLSKTVQNELINIVTIFLGVSVGATATGTTFLSLQTIKIMLMGVVAFSFGTAGGVLLAKFMNLFLKEKINPLIGSAGVSAVPMAARVSQMVGQKYNPGNFLLMHAMGPNVAGVIGSAIAAGVLISLYG